MKRLPRWVGLLALVVACGGWGQGNTEPAGAYTVRHYNPRIQQGIDLIYSLRYAEAEAYFADIIAAYPDNPVGHFFLAMVGWWRVLIDLEDRSHDEAFYALLEKCIKVCDARLKKDPHDFDAILFKGGAIGFRGRLRGDRHQYLKAARDGMRCLPLLGASQKLEPRNKDILFGQGVYNYFAEAIPERYPVVRPVMWFLQKGDRQKGLEQLKEVAESGHYARTEAAYFLARIYRIFEKDKYSAQTYLEQLYARYPDNALFHRYLARNLVELGQWKRGVALYQGVIRRSEAGQTGYHVRGHMEALYHLGKFALYRYQLGLAAARFKEVGRLGAGLDDAEENAFAVMSRLMLGMTYDAQGKRQDAVVCYERVEKMEEHGDSRNLARKYLKEPYRGRR